MQKNELFDFAVSTAEKAGEFLLTKFRTTDPSEARGTSKEVKSLYDNLTDKIIKNEIEQRFPEHSYLTEETGFVDKQSSYVWIIDPLDGTSNFVNHNPLFSVSIALWFEGKPLLGVIECPATRERFIAVADEGAYRVDLLRKQRIPAKLSNVAELSRAYIVACEGGEGNTERYRRDLMNTFSRVKEIRKLGSAAIELASVGCGRAEAYITFCISLWDIAAGILFVKEAGGRILRFDGKPYAWQDFVYNPEKKYNLVATNGNIDREFFEKIKLI